MNKDTHIKVIEKAKKIYPKLAKFADGEYSFFWIKKIKEEYWLTFSLFNHSEGYGSENKIVNVDTLMKEDFRIEDTENVKVSEKYLEHLKKISNE